MLKKTFIQCAVNNGLTEAQAETVLNVYMKLKVLSYNAHDQYKIKHGAFMDALPMINALNYKGD